LAELIAEQTGKSVEQITADSDRDKWFTATEALEYGFIDKIVSGSGDVTGGGGTAERRPPAPPTALHARRPRDLRSPRPRRAPDRPGGPPGPHAQFALRAASVRGAHRIRHEAPGPLHQAVRGPHHLPRRPGRRRLGRRRHGPAAGP